MSKPLLRHCAVYTRKSSDERLDMEFNSLDAQREACLAYISSQKSEGWVPSLEIYDDGGFSGGTMERPALQRLMEDIKAGKIHIVVVYKIDRLTRSLMDFSKLVETFDQFGVTFVSITQSFNTTTSMGRLTLNVLLSFAQFEREVTGERIRDKIAASKRKGMWMGGMTPIGYDVKDRQLFINEDEAARIRLIFDRYLEVGSVPKLKKELAQKGIKSKDRIRKSGLSAPGCNLTRSAIHKILINPLYIGKIRHKDAVYDGRHEPIVSQELWQAVQDKLSKQAAFSRGTKKANYENLLRGILFDKQGVFYSPVFSNKKRKRYRYYVSQNLLQHRDVTSDFIDRFPAYEIESRVETGIREHLSDIQLLNKLLDFSQEKDQRLTQLISDGQHSVPIKRIVRETIAKVEAEREQLTIHVKTERLKQLLSKTLEVHIPYKEEDTLKLIQVPFITKRAHTHVAFVDGDSSVQKDRLDLTSKDLKNLIRGIVWRDEHFAGLTLREISQREQFSEGFISKCIFGSFELLQAR